VATAEAGSPKPTVEEIVELIRQARERARAGRLADSPASEVVPLPDLMPLLHARDAAEGKVAAIGTVNPRPPGLLNELIQAGKRLLARLLEWHVREQVEFNRATVDALTAILEAFNQTNRVLSRLAAELHEGIGKQLRELVAAQGREFSDIRSHWHAWREGWERKLAEDEIRFLRTVAELEAAFQHRVAELEASFRQQLQTQHSDYAKALEKSVIEIQQRLWSDLERVRTEYERLIHYELRMVRQYLAWLPGQLAQPASGQPPQQGPLMDRRRFAEKFRGDEASIRERQRRYVERFRNHSPVLDLGCGRGEFLELLREAGIEAWGIEQDPALVELCRRKALPVEQGDLLEVLGRLGDGTLGGAFCSHVIEHLDPVRVPVLLETLGRKLARDGLLIIETPNPECLVIFASHFYLDPTHTRPVPPALLAFYLEEAGFGRIEFEPLAPAVEAFPELEELPARLRQRLFGYLDYAMIARRL